MFRVICPLNSLHLGPGWLYTGSSQAAFGDLTQNRPIEVRLKFSCDDMAATPASRGAENDLRYSSCIYHN
jgi:hypothetical protein